MLLAQASSARHRGAARSGDPGRPRSGPDHPAAARYSARPHLRHRLRLRRRRRPRSAALRSRVQAGVRPLAGFRPQPVLAADRLAVGECTEPARSDPPDGRDGRSLLDNPCEAAPARAAVQTRQRCRHSATSGRFCSAALRLFFPPPTAFWRTATAVVSATTSKGCRFKLTPCAFLAARLVGRSRSKPMWGAMPNRTTLSRPRDA
jgi:hypothetical protein